MSTYVPIQAITLSANTSTIEFTGIPQTYTDLILVIRAKNTQLSNVYFRVGNNTVDSGSNYSRTVVTGTGSAAQSYRYSNQTSGNMTYMGYVDTVFNSSQIAHFMNYSNTTTNKTIINRAGSTAWNVEAVVNLWRSTAAINTIHVYGDNTFNADSTFTLYGIGSGSPKAFGGDRVVTDGTYWYHAFTSSGRFEPVQNLSADILVIAGGGAGGVGGGGAGGVQYFANQSLTSISYTCTVGGGGTAGGPANPNASTAGVNSSFGSLTAATGGGKGAPNDNNTATPYNGGSGGGGGGSSTITTVAGLGSSGQGNNGGTNGGQTNSSFPAGGGGGATAVGVNASSGTIAGAGGNGTSTYSSWGAATSTGQNISGTRWFAGGGGGGLNGGGTAGAGGNGGGGAGNTSSANATAGTANTGGGGGGVGGGTATQGTGGSGIIIVRYAV